MLRTSILGFMKAPPKLGISTDLGGTHWFSQWVWSDADSNLLLCGWQARTATVAYRRLHTKSKPPPSLLLVINVTSPKCPTLYNHIATVTARWFLGRCRKGWQPVPA